MRVAQVVQRPDNLEQGLHRGLPDSVIVVREQADELDRALLDVGKEMAASRAEERAHRVSSDLLFNADRAVHVKQLVEVHVLLYLNVAVLAVDDRDRVRRRGARGEVSEGLGIGRCSRSFSERC